MTPFPFVMQGDNITVVVGSTPHTISKTHITYNRVLEAIKAQDWATVEEIINPKKVVLDYGQGNVSVQGDRVFWKDRELHNALTSRMIQMLQEEFSIEPLVKFMENLMNNPSKRAVDELYGFLERCNLPITPDGCFLAFKKVNADYTDVHSGTVPNMPIDIVKEEFEDRPKSIKCGKKQEVLVTFDYENNTTIVEMDRNAVDDDMHNECSYGLHVCSLHYLEYFGGGRIMIVKVNPRDVVSFPADYNSSKGRVCRYEVVSELGVDPEAAFTDAVQATANEPVQMTFPSIVI